MIAICETCQQAFHIPHRRGTRLRDQSCPRGHRGLLYAVCAGCDSQGTYYYQARSKPELKFPIHWGKAGSLILPVAAATRSFVPETIPLGGA
jgi:hypothetical protein